MKKFFKVAAVIMAAMLVFGLAGCKKTAKVEKDLAELKNYTPYLFVLSDEVVDESLAEYLAGKNWKIPNKAYSRRDEAISVISARKDVTLLDRNSVDKIKAEMKFQNSDWSDENKTVRLGKALNATGVLSVEITDEWAYEGNITFLDINSMQKITHHFESNLGFATWKAKIKMIDLSSLSKAPLSVDNPFADTVSYRVGDIEKSGVYYTAEVPPCPFGTTLPVVPKEKVLKKELKDFCNIKYMNFDLFEVTIGYNDGSEEVYEFEFHPSESAFVAQKGNDYYTDYKIGTLDIFGLGENIGVYKNSKRDIVLCPRTTDVRNTGYAYFMQMKKN